MTKLGELMVAAAVATEGQLDRALEAMRRVGIETPLAGFLSMAEVCIRYGNRRTGRPLAKSTVYRKGLVAAKKIGGEVYFREEDVVQAFDPGALQNVG